ncbi:MAG: hypothetical protein LBS56_09895 [Propionibacteriaceae bacterium]|jgi:hypothetical protein|nr:hypothetical protein [Propionibacteriaceae bacterium]
MELLHSFPGVSEAGYTKLDVYARALVLTESSGRESSVTIVPKGHVVRVTTYTQTSAPAAQNVVAIQDSRDYNYPFLAVDKFAVFNALLGWLNG